MGLRRDKDETTGHEISPAEAQAALRVAVAIVGALVLSAPSFAEVVKNERDFVSAAWWFLLSFTAFRIALAIVWGVWATYRRSIDENRLETERNKLAVDLDRRRAEAVTRRAADLDGDEIIR